MIRTARHVTRALAEQLLVIETNVQRQVSREERQIEFNLLAQFVHNGGVPAEEVASSARLSYEKIGSLLKLLFNLDVTEAAMVHSLKVKLR